MSNGTYQAYSPFDILTKEAQIAPYKRNYSFQNNIESLTCPSGV